MGLTTRDLNEEIYLDLAVPLRTQADAVERYQEEARSGGEFAEIARRIVGENAEPDAIRALADRVEKGDLVVGSDYGEVGVRLDFELSEPDGGRVGAVTLVAGMSSEELVETLRPIDPVEHVEGVAVYEKVIHHAPGDERVAS